MSIERFFTKSVNTQRLVKLGGVGADKDTEIWEAKLTGVLCHIQTWMAGETGYEGIKFPTHSMWCDVGIDIIEGDRVIDGTKTYEVMSVEELDYGKNPHLSIALSVIE